MPASENCKVVTSRSTTVVILSVCVVEVVGTDVLFFISVMLVGAGKASKTNTIDTEVPCPNVRVSLGPEGNSGAPEIT